MAERCRRTRPAIPSSTAISGLRGKLGKEAVRVHGDRFRLRPGAIALDVDRLLRGEVLATEFEDALDVDGFLQSFDLHRCAAVLALA